ncbi:selenophosphate synthase [Cytobacillus purgationiresistens]|uniref:Selenophosphate synthase n=1 Tax=Cytobacillus purgationiresistens TaxID=863449 RepID=A0ABU0AEE0_9BACI|nr:selenophosphate synthase [Cytobacillus purgationiresistens]
MAKGSNVSIHIDYASIPMIEGTFELAKEGVIPGGTKSNHKWLQNDVEYQQISLEEQLILCDAITSGGLLVALSETEANEYLNALKESGNADAAIIGRVSVKQDKLIYIEL